ncbi:hypothetical protein I7X12_05630 [Halosimplex litoreum]|uniref:Uncharacterized protein n=1 Tax=Halosimplex litoreum TaxID=1198301 RepID=A0A7T3G0N3_9EURY|nr:hypothetical protein [Halosimplex litoreum]QPV64106.1 hypothetical protein I7X12_05630 [Halosimplex litoreum]
MSPSSVLLQFGGLLDIDIAGYVKEAFTWYASVYLDAARRGLDVLLDIYAAVLREALTLDPDMLASVEGVYQLSTGLFFALLAVMALSQLALSQLALGQLFPRSSATDLHRFTERTFVAIVLIYVVNPPGDGTLFARGLFAWAFELVNALQDYLLADLASLDVTVNLGSPTESLSSVLRAALTGGLVSILLLLSLLLGQLALALRQFVLVSIYALFPLLLSFWLVDIGPLKYARQIAEIAFQLAVVLLVAGVLIAGMLNASLGLLAGGTVGGEAATARAVVDQSQTQPGSGSELGVVRGGALAADPGGSIQGMIAEMMFLMVSGFGVFGVLVVAVLQLFSSVGDGGGGGGSGAERRGDATSRGTSSGQSMPGTLADRVGLSGGLVGGRFGDDERSSVLDSGSIAMGIDSGGNGDGFDNPSVVGEGGRHEALTNIEFSDTVELPTNEHTQKEVVSETTYPALAEAERKKLDQQIRTLDPDDSEMALRTVDTDEGRRLALDDDGYIEIDGELTAKDMQLAHEVWKSDGSSHPGGQLWEKMVREHHDIDEKPSGAIPVQSGGMEGYTPYEEHDFGKGMELSDEAEEALDVYQQASHRFIEENHEKIDAASVDEETGEITLDLQRGLTHRTGDMARQVLEDFDAESYELPRNQAVSNTSASKSTAEGYATEWGTGMVVEKTVDKDEIVISDAIRTVKKNGMCDDRFDPEEGVVMGDDEYQVPGGAIGTISGREDESGVKLTDGDGQSTFKDALKNPDQLTVEGHQHTAKTLQKVADDHDRVEVDDVAKDCIEDWYKNSPKEEMGRNQTGEGERGWIDDSETKEAWEEELKSDLRKLGADV